MGSIPVWPKMTKGKPRPLVESRSKVSEFIQ